MDEEENYKIEKLTTPLGDAASAQSTVKAINYILRKIKELDDYYTDKLKFADFSTLEPIIEGIHERLSELKTNQDLITKKITEFEAIIDNLKPLSSSSATPNGINSNNQIEPTNIQEVKESISIGSQKNLTNLMNKLLTLQVDENIQVKTQLSDFYAIYAPEDISKSLETLGGYIDQKDSLGAIFSFLTFPDAEIPQTYKIMLYGPDGNGKTSMIHALAKKYGYSLIIPDFSVLASYYNNKQIQELILLFKKIKEEREIKPSILFLDNFEMIAGKESPKHVLKTLILEMERLNLADHRTLIVASTQSLEDINPLVLKRFDEFIEFLNPNELEKSKILRILIEKVKLGEDLDIDDLINDIAFNSNTQGFSCADLEKLIKIVNFISVKEHRVHAIKADFINSLQKIKNLNNLIKQKKLGKSLKVIEKAEKIEVLEDEITNLKNITSTSQGIIKHGLRLALSENFDFVDRLFNLYKGNNTPFTLEEASKVLGLSIADTKKILQKDSFRLIFPEIDNSYHVSFNQKMFDEISMEIGFGLQGE